MNDISVIDDIRITTDEDGNQHFDSVENSNGKFTYNRSWWQKFKDWIFDGNITPYIKVRDLSDPFGDRKKDPFDDGSGSATGVEAGIKISF